MLSEAQVISSRCKLIERLVFSGGGAKGVAYPGAYRALVDAGVHNGVKEVAGSSAGSVPAVMMAVGMTKEMFRERLLGLNFQTLLGSRIGSLFRTNKEGVVFFTKDGKPMIDELRRGIRDSILAFIDEIKGSSPEPDVLAIIERFKQNPETPFMFRDLAILTRCYPTRFKKLTVTAVKLSNGDLQIFNCDLTPDIEIALASRASCSLPVMLEPVTIRMGDKDEKFIDGGLYDNIPTNYFDMDEKKNFLSNQKKDQTLLFMFAGGFHPTNSVAYNALYGECWDEYIVEEEIETLIREALEITRLEIVGLKNTKVTANAKLQLFSGNLKKRFEELGNSAPEKESVGIMANKLQALLIDLNKKLLLHVELLQGMGEGILEEDKIDEFSKAIISAFKPVVCKAGKTESFIHDYLLKWFGIKTDYDTLDKKKEGYQKIRQQYALRTVELRMGPVSSLNFEAANKNARMVDSFSYLNTINYITNHDLHDKDIFYPGVFYSEIVNNFEAIYTALLLGTGHLPKDDLLLIEIESLKAKLTGKQDALIYRQVYQVIKDSVDSRKYTKKAFALSRAVEFQTNRLEPEQLLEEIYRESFVQGKRFSVSNVTGETYYRASALTSFFEKNKCTFGLLDGRPNQVSDTRMRVVFNALKKMEKFDSAYQQYCQQMTPDVKFDLLLKAFKIKVDELGRKSLREFNYCKAFLKASKLHEQLLASSKKCFKDKTLSVQKFKKDSLGYISEALRELKHHRGGVLVNFLRHIIYFFRNLNPFKSQFFDAAKTDSVNKLDLLINGLNAIQDSPRPMS